MFWPPFGAPSKRHDWRALCAGARSSMVTPSCPVLLILDDDAFRRDLIKVLDQNHFSVTFSADGEGAVKVLEQHSGAFNVIIVGLDLAKKRGMHAIEHLRDHRSAIGCGVIIVGEPNPSLRTFAPWADETLMKPVDPKYVATRARVYCKC